MIQVGRAKSTLLPILVLSLALGMAAGCAETSFDPERPRSLGRLLVANETVIGATDCTDPSTGLAEAERRQLARAAEALVPYDPGSPLESQYPGYYIKIRLPNGDTLNIHLQSPDRVEINGRYNRGGQGLWEVAREVYPVLPGDDDLLGQLFLADSLVIAGMGLDRTYRVSDNDTAAWRIARVVRLLRESVYCEPPASTLERPVASLVFTVGGHDRVVTVYPNLLEIDGELFWQSNLAMILGSNLNAGGE
ncbi:MAG: hypothetical protein AB1331_01140 [Bacillota bacterium]